MNSIDQFAAHIGLDWADKKHDICVQFNYATSNSEKAPYR